ncbi:MULTISPECIES: hypothetical protein [Bacteroidales]|uniref:hypothetical protein n=1 Tax=Bacteroidales TaxID=171549 RepID=UPI000B3A5A2A|nr:MULTISPECIES: hypothetical protein [Bacteroidales]OUO85194.1 hypothetical protein B5F71_00080 [Bacteroides sp. An269]
MGQQSPAGQTKEDACWQWAGIRGCFSKAEVPVCLPKTTCVRLPSLRGSAQWTEVRKDWLPLIILGRGAGYACYKRKMAQVHKSREIYKWQKPQVWLQLCTYI